MRRTAKIISTATAVAALMGALSLAPLCSAYAADDKDKQMTPVEKGKKLTSGDERLEQGQLAVEADRAVGFRWACHCVGSILGP